MVKNKWGPKVEAGIQFVTKENSEKIWHAENPELSTWVGHLFVKCISGSIVASIYEYVAENDTL